MLQGPKAFNTAQHHLCDSDSSKVSIARAGLSMEMTVLKVLVDTERIPALPPDKAVASLLTDRRHGQRSTTQQCIKCKDWFCLKNLHVSLNGRQVGQHDHQAYGVGLQLHINQTNRHSLQAFVNPHRTFPSLALWYAPRKTELLE